MGQRGLTLSSTGFGLCAIYRVPGNVVTERASLRVFKESCGTQGLPLPRGHPPCQDRHEPPGAGLVQTLQRWVVPVPPDAGKDRTACIPLCPGALAAKSHLDVISIPSSTHSSHPEQSYPRCSGKACSWPSSYHHRQGQGLLAAERSLGSRTRGSFPTKRLPPSYLLPGRPAQGLRGPACCPRRSLLPTRPWLYL